MLDCAQSFLLNEAALNSLINEQRSIFIYEWLCFLNQVLGAAQQVMSIFNITRFTEYHARSE